MEFLDLWKSSRDTLYAEYSKSCWSEQRLRLYGGKKRVFAKFLNRVEKGKSGDLPDTRPVVLAYGSAKFAPTGRGELSVPTSTAFKECKNRFECVLVDEFRTSKMYHEDGTLLQQVGVCSDPKEAAEADEGPENKESRQRTFRDISDLLSSHPNACYTISSSNFLPWDTVRLVFEESLLALPLGVIGLETMANIVIITASSSCTRMKRLLPTTDELMRARAFSAFMSNVYNVADVMDAAEELSQMTFQFAKDEMAEHWYNVNDFLMGCLPEHPLDQSRAFLLPSGFFRTPRPVCRRAPLDQAASDHLFKSGSCLEADASPGWVHASRRRHPGSSGAADRQG
eukprot:gene17265-23582_t